MSDETTATTLTPASLRAAMRHLKKLNDKPIKFEPVVLPAWLYDKAKAQGLNLHGHVRQEAMSNSVMAD